MANNEMNGSVEENREDQRENREDAIVKAEDVVAEEAPVVEEKAAEEKTEKAEVKEKSEKKAEKNKDDNGDDTVGFDELELPDDIVNAVRKVGFETPSPIQAATIPTLMSGRDVVGLAQTGTGKTAAFALPILARIDRSVRAPQALVLAPTRELALQVADSFQSFADHLGKIQVLPIYGGQDIN
ncbi:MAG: DEAD/DEAH box helicase, partial [Corynebacterium sp.]|nr:DEAD/DEAH box helicase [Corynebacterium sp.]